MIGNVLAFASPRWAEWALSVTDSARSGALLEDGGKSVAKSLMAFLGPRLPDSGPERLDLICEDFGILTSGNKLIVGDHNRKASTDSWTTTHHEVELAITMGKGTVARKRSVCAHEVGHLFCSLAWEISQNTGSGDVKLKRPEFEHWSWDFGLELMCPSSQRRNWTAWSLSRVPDKLDKKSLNVVVTLGVGRLFGLAQLYRLSLRNLLVGLNHLPLLSELKEGVAVMQIAPNANTGATPALRIVQLALPDGVFVPRNRRARKQGFLHAELFYDEAPFLSYCVTSECVLMKVRDEKTLRWSSFSCFPSDCLYVPVRSEDSRFLVATWRYGKMEPEKG